MKWRTVKEGDRRRRVYFALIPRRCDDGMTRWLERIEEIHEWKYGGWVLDGAYYWARVSRLPLNGLRTLP